MKSLKILALGAAAALVAVAVLGAGTAAATNLYRYTTPSANDRILTGTEILLSLNSGTSLLLRDTAGVPNDTCTGSEMRLTLEKDTSSLPATNAQGPMSVFSLSGCSHTSTTLAAGSLEVKSIAGTTNGTAISKGTRITLKSTVFGLSCIINTGAGTVLGAITGAKSSTATAVLDFNAVLTLENGCGDSTVTGTYGVTTPIGLTVEPS